MLRKFSILVLLTAITAADGWKSVDSQTINPADKNEISKRKGKTSNPKKIEFGGAGFVYDPQIFSEARFEEAAENPLENETDKPDSVVPRHLLFKLKNSKLDREATVYIFPIEDYRKMYAVSRDNTERFDKELNGLKKTLNDKNYRIDKQIPFIPFWDGSQSFQQKVKHLSFKDGKGIFFLTQFDIEPSLVNNEGLKYVFQGITGDGKNYVLAEFPVNVAFLPKDFSANEFEGYNLPEYFWADESNEKRYTEYLSKVTQRLEKLAQNEFEPNLNSLEKLISSLKIEK